jgi:hypothetical protein
MATLLFGWLAAVWIGGVGFCTAMCARYEAEHELHGALGALIGTGWLRGSNARSRQWRRWTLSFAAGGLMILILLTRAALSYS